MPSRDTFELREGGERSLSEDHSRFLQPGEQEIGWVARTGRIPLGYFDDPEAPPARPSRSSTGQRVVILGGPGIA